MHELSHEFTNRKISPWGGIKYFQQVYERSGLREDLSRMELPEGGSNRAYDPLDIIEGFMVSVVLGSRRLAHTGLLRSDEVIREIFGWKKGMASQSTFSRFFKRFDIQYNDKLFTQIQKQWWDKMNIGKMTIDVDSTVITRYGQQEGAEVGYNPHKPGRASHHPLIAFNDELKMVVNAWMREGNASANSGMDCFIDQLLEIIPPDRIGLLRGDKGFYDHHIMEDLEEKEVPYIIRAKMTGRLMETILEQQQWYSNDDVAKGARYTEFFYQGQGWLQPRRIIVVAKPKEKEVSKQGLLFSQSIIQEAYEFSAYVTSTKLSPMLVHSTYNKRGDCENRIKELKYDFAIDGFALQSFGAMEAAFRFIMIAYNLTALFKQKVMTGPVRHRLSTIRFQCIAIGSYLVTNGRKKKMKLSAEGKRRHFLEHFFDNLEFVKPPFQFSNA